MKWRLLNFIENHQENNEMEHLGDPISFIRSPITYMKLIKINYIYEMDNEIDNEISLKTLRKTMKWVLLHFIQNPQENNEMGTAPFDNYIHQLHSSGGQGH